MNNFILKILHLAGLDLAGLHLAGLPTSISIQSALPIPGSYIQRHYQCVPAGSNCLAEN